jgi:hypothetical protein
MIYKPKEALIEVADVLVKHGLMGEYQNRNLKIRLEYSELKHKGLSRREAFKKLRDTYHVGTKSLNKILWHIDTERDCGGQQNKSTDQTL